MRLIPPLVAGVLLTACSATGPQSPASGTISSRPWEIRSDPQVAATLVESAGVLEHRGTLWLDEIILPGTDRVGGFSALHVAVDPQGTPVLTTFADRDGLWLQAELLLAADGSLAGVRYRAHGYLADRIDNVEAVADYGSQLLLSFDDAGHILEIPADLESGSGRSRVWAELPGYEQLDNAGVETITFVPGSGLLCISEEQRTGDGEDRLVWLVADSGEIAKLAYRPVSGKRPGGATTLPSGDVVVLDTRWDGKRNSLALTRITRSEIERAVDAAADGSYPVLQGQRLIILDPGEQQVLDNFEGVAAFEHDGSVFLLLIADDNFGRYQQRTLLLLFRLVETGTA